MRLLFDLITTQKYVGGSAEYVRKVFFSLLDFNSRFECGIHVVCLVDTGIKSFVYHDLAPDNLRKLDVEVVDVNSSSLGEILVKYRIDKVFMGCGQLLQGYDLENVTCPVDCVIHDMCTEEYDTNLIEDYVRLDNFFTYLRYKLHIFRHGNKVLEGDRKLFQMLRNNNRSKLITVSNYSKYSINFNYGVPMDKIHVLYSPERILKREKNIIDVTLRNLISSKKKFYLMLSANRLMKNANKAIRAFHRFTEEKGKDCYFVTVGYKEKRFDNHIVIDYLSESDLANAIVNCYALVFPSFFEGFGYPPIEAMSYGKPVLCSNVTSIREVVGDAAIYFCPFYESDIFKALMILNDDNYEEYAVKAKNNYQKIHKKQEEDLRELLSNIVSL